MKKTQKGKPNPWLVIIGTAMILYFIYRSFEDFVALHNGAPLEQVTSFRYSPVFSEALLLVIITTLASMIGAIMLVVGNLIADILLKLVDPRITIE